MRFVDVLALSVLCVIPVSARADEAEQRAAATERAMIPAERTLLTHGILAIPLFTGASRMPDDAVLGAGYVAGIPRLGIPSLKETDASLGVAYVMGLRRDGATALPSGMALGATWDPALLRQAGKMIGGEAKTKGFNVMLAGGVNLIREPRNGRTFEYLGEDPLHSGVLAGAAVAGIQENHIISTVKHFAFNNQETGRDFLDVKIAEAAARESDLLAFEIAIEQGHPGAVMCAYNKVNGVHACDSDWLLGKVLKRDWGYKGFVMADWGATPGLEAAQHGLDQQSGAEFDRQVFFDKPLAAAAASDPAYSTRLADMNRRILRSIFAIGTDALPPAIMPIDFKANGDVAEKIAKAAIVLLRNRGGALPLQPTAKRITVIGGYADTGVLSGGGSSQVQGADGPAAAIPLGGDGPLARFINEAYQRSSPLKALKARVPEAQFKFRDGRYVSDAVDAARGADVVIIFATQWMTEGLDVPDLSLPRGQDALIDGVASVNRNTVVVLETGGPVTMPWLDKTAAVIEAWYPGARGGEAIAAVLFGDTNPSGRLPITFPVGVDQLPRPKLDGSESVEPDFQGIGRPGQTLDVNYDIEGSDVGYRWFARSGARPAFAFGYGLSYTSFSRSGLSVSAAKSMTARFTETNSGPRAGIDVSQLYLVSAAGRATRRLVAWDRLALDPGASSTRSVTIDPRLIASWQGGGWEIVGGRYGFSLGASAEDLGPVVWVNLPAQRLKP